MSVHTFPSSTGDPADADRLTRLRMLADLLGRQLRHVASITDDGVLVSIEFQPDLSTSEENRLRRLLVPPTTLLTVEEWISLSDEREAIRTYILASSPTAAQRELAFRGLIRVVRMMIRD